jgi:hypothetical protein
VQHQRGHGNSWQEVSHVGVAQRLEHRPNAAGTGGRAQQPAPPDRAVVTVDLPGTRAPEARIQS